MIIQLKYVLAVLITGSMHSDFRTGHWMNETLAEDITPCSSLILESVRWTWLWREGSYLFLGTVMSTFSWFLDYTVNRCCCQLISVTQRRLSDPESSRCSVEASTFKKILFIGWKSNTNASSVQIHRNRPNIIDPLCQALFRECLK